MGLITPSDLTWNGKEVMQLSEAVLERVYNEPALNAFHTLVPGIKAKQQIAILGRLGLVGKKGHATNCEPSASTEKISSSEKFWNPVWIEDRFQQCWKDLKASFHIWGLQNGVNKSDLTGTDFLNFIEDRLTDAIIRAIYRHAWFGKTDIALTSASPAGTLKAGTSTDYFNAIDGFWEQIFDIVTADSTKRETISENAEASYAAQKFDATDTSNMKVTGIFEDMVTNADERLTDQPDKIIIATKSMVDQYKKELRGQSLDASFEKIEGGFQALEFDGIPVIPFSFQDRTIKSYFDDGSKYYRPHRALLTVPGALQVGVEEESALGEFDPFFDKKTKEFYIDLGWSLDVKIVEKELVHAAY